MKVTFFIPIALSFTFIFLNENRKLFFEKVTPILLDYINELGIEVLLNKDTVALASLGSDITISAINKINEQLKN